MHTQQQKQSSEESKFQSANARKKYIHATQNGQSKQLFQKGAPEQINIKKQTVQILSVKSPTQCKPQQSPQIQVTQVDSQLKKQLDNEATGNQQKNSCFLNLTRIKPDLNQNGDQKKLTTVTISLASPSPLQLKKTIDPPILSSNELHSLKAIKNGPTVKNPQVDAQSVLEKWRAQHWERNANGKDIDGYLALKSVQFKKFKYSIFILQRAALKIQHWFFKLRASQQRNQQLKEAVLWSTTTSQQSYHTRVNKEEMPLTMQEKERENLRKLVAQRISPGMLGVSPNYQLERKLHLQNSGSRNRQITSIPNNENKEISHFDVNDAFPDLNEKQQRSSADLTSSITKRNFFKNDLGSLSSIRFDQDPAALLTDSSQTPVHSQIAQDRSSIYSKLLRSSKSTANIERVNHIAQGYEEQSYYKISNLTAEQQQELRNINTKATTDASKVSIDSKVQQTQKQISISVKIPTETQSLIRRIRPSKDIAQAMNVREGENRAQQVFESYSREREYMSRRSKHGSKDAPSLRESSPPPLLLIQYSESCLLPASIILEEKFESQPQNSSEAEEEKLDAVKQKKSKVEAESILMKMRKRKEVTQVISNLKQTVTKTENRNSSIERNNQRTSPSRNIINRIEENLDNKQKQRSIDCLSSNDEAKQNSKIQKQDSPVQQNNDDLQIHISRLQSPENIIQSPPQNISNQVLQSFIEKQQPSRNVQHIHSNTLTLTSQGGSLSNLNQQRIDNSKNSKQQQTKIRSTSHNQRRVSLLQPLSQQLMSTNLLQKSGHNERVNQRYQQQVKRHQSLSLKGQQMIVQQAENRINDLAHIKVNQLQQEQNEHIQQEAQIEPFQPQQSSLEEVKQLLDHNGQEQEQIQVMEDNQKSNQMQFVASQQNKAYQETQFFKEDQKAKNQHQHGLAIDEPSEFLSPGIKFDVSPIQLLKQEQIQVQEANQMIKQKNQTNEERTPSPINLSRYPQKQMEAAPTFKHEVDQNVKNDTLRDKRRMSQVKTTQQSKQASMMQQSLSDYMNSKLARKSQISQSLTGSILSRNLNQQNNVKSMSLESQLVVQSRNEYQNSMLALEHKTQNQVLSKLEVQDNKQFKDQYTKNEDYRISPSPPPPLKPSSNKALTRNTINADHQQESIYAQRFSMSLKNNRPSILEEPRDLVPNPESQPYLSVMQTLQTKNSHSNTPEREIVHNAQMNQSRATNNDGRQTQKVQFVENTQRRSSIYNMLEQNKLSGKIQELKSSVLQKPIVKDSSKPSISNVKNTSQAQNNTNINHIKPRVSQAVQSQNQLKQTVPQTYRESVMQPIIYQASSSSSATISGAVSQKQSTTSLNSRQERNKDSLKQASTYEEFKVLQQKQAQKTLITSTAKSKERAMDKRSSVSQLAHLKQQRSYERVLNNMSKFSQSVLASKHGQQTTQSNAHSHLSISDQISLPSSHQSSSLATY